MSDGEDVQVPPAGKPSLKQRLSHLFSEYGRIAIVTYFVLSILTIIGFSVAFAIGTAPETATGITGVIFAGWIAAKATLPLRILITLAITPAVSYVVTWLARRRHDGAPPDGAA